MAETNGARDGRNQWDQGWQDLVGPRMAGTSGTRDNRNQNKATAGTSGTKYSIIGTSETKYSIIGTSGTKYSIYNRNQWDQRDGREPWLTCRKPIESGSRIGQLSLGDVPRGIIQRDAVRIFKWTDTTLHLFSKKERYGYNKRELLKRGGGG
jgi:hypothetical protein